MPFWAVTTPPWAPVDGMGVTDVEADGDAVAVLAGMVASAPSRTSTWPAATAELALAVTLNSDAIWPPLADAPVP